MLDTQPVLLSAAPVSWSVFALCKVWRSKFYGVAERKKQPDAVREVPGAKIEIPEPGILVPWVLCGHGREKCKEDTGVHPMSVRAGQSRRAADHAKLLKCPFTGGK